MTLLDAVATFECPLHGTEREVFCWRAYDEKLRAFWSKCRIDGSNITSLTDEEYKECIFVTHDDPVNPGHY